MVFSNSDLNAGSSANLVFIDSNIDNYQTLVSGIENAEVVLLDSSRNGIAQITDRLANYSNLESIQIFSHGDNGSLQLGNTLLNGSTLDSYSNKLQQWANFLSDDGDLLFYGCNLAAGSDGLALVEEISQLTSADVAASNDLTGHSSLGGDWDLEVVTGKIETQVAINQATQESYLGQLNLLVNGSFEANAVDGDRWANFAAGDVASWQSLNGERIEIWDSGHAGVASSNGTNHMELDYRGGSNLDAIYQDIATVAGQTYTLTFDMRSRGTNFNSDDESVVVEWNGVKTKVDGYRATAVGEWRTISVEVTGTGGSDRLLIRESGTPGASDGTGPFLDNISLEANASEPNPNGNEYRYIRFVANSEVNGNPWTSVAELNVLDANGNTISQANWNLVSVDSEETVAEFAPATNSFDGNNSTFWHTEWAAPGNANDPAHDHEIVIDLGSSYELSGFNYLPRQNGPNGRVANYQFFATDNTSNWGGALATGIFNNTTALQTVQFDNNNPNPPSEGGLVGYWKFDEVSADTQVADASGNGNNGTNINIDPGITSYSGPINSAPIFDEFNPRSWIFDGVNDYVRIDPSPELDFSDGPFSQSVWIRPTATDNNYHGILGYQNGAGANNRAPGLWTVGQTRIHAGFGDGTNWNNFTTGDVLRLNEWNHVVSSFNGTSYKIHVDGQEVFSTDVFAGRMPVSVDRLDIGRVDNYFEGQIDEVRLYDRAISSGEIQDLYVEQPNKAEVGDWSSPIEFPNIPVAAAVLPNGKVVTWSSWDRFTFGGGNSPQQSYTSVWDPETGEVGEVLVTNTDHDMFCPGIAMLPDGRLLVMGGGEFVRSTSIYDFETETWSDGADMEYRRWYNSALTLSNGEVFTIGGERNNTNGGRITSGVGEIWNESTGWRTLSGTPIAPIANSGDRGTEHPQIFLAPNGKVFAAGPSPTMYWYDVNGNGSITEAGTRGDSPYSQVGAAIMYDEGKILFTGGARLYSGEGEVYNEAYSIDINNENNVTIDKQDSMSYERNYQTGVVLPNGEVLVVGGERGNRAFRDNQAVYRPELWNPETGEWTLMDNHEIPRTYHSVALLLPDGRVMAGGGGLAGEGSPVNHPDVEIFTPPYLYNEDGTLADRPVIGAGTNAVGYNESFSISMDTDMPITEFNLVRMSAVTHGINTDQRFLSVDFTDLGNDNYQLNSPENGNIAPPGQYMLFAMNDKGVPSEAKIIQISASGG